MRILWLGKSLLHPVDFGGRIRSYQLLRQLVRRHEITFLALDEWRSGPEVHAAAAEYCHALTVVPHPRAAAFSAGFWLDLARNLVSPRPYFVMACESAPMRRAIADALRMAPPELIVCDFLATSVNLADTPGVPRLLFEHNVESAIWRRLAEAQGGGPRRLYLREQWRKTRRFEAAACRRFDHVVAVSEADRAALARASGRNNVSAIPTGVDAAYFRPGPPERVRPAHLVFTGAMDWLPNQDAMLFFLREILPRLRRARPEVTLTIVGRHPLPELARACRDLPGVTLTGRVDDTRPFMEEAAVIVVPLRAGGGTRLKIYEAMAMDKPVVSTRVGAEGLPLTEERDILLADTPEAFAAAVLRLLDRPEEARAMGQRAGARVRAEQGWEVAADRFEVIARAVAERRAVPPAN